MLNIADPQRLWADAYQQWLMLPKPQNLLLRAAPPEKILRNCRARLQIGLLAVTSNLQTSRNRARCRVGLVIPPPRMLNPPPNIEYSQCVVICHNGAFNTGGDRGGGWV